MPLGYFPGNNTKLLGGFIVLHFSKLLMRKYCKDIIGIALKMFIKCYLKSNKDKLTFYFMNNSIIIEKYF